MTPQWPGSQQVAAPGPDVAVASLSEVLAPADSGTQPCGPGPLSAFCVGGSVCSRALGFHWVSWNGPPHVREAAGSPALLGGVGVFTQQGLPHTHRLLFERSDRPARATAVEEGG